MRQTIPSGAILALLLTGLFAPSIGPDAIQVGEVAGLQGVPVIFEADVPVRGTFLRAYEWWPYCGAGEYAWDSDLEMMVGVSTSYHLEGPLIVDLQAQGFSEGDEITISYEGPLYFSGAFNPANPHTANDDNGYDSIGLFSSTSELKPADELDRVPGAIDAGKDYVTWPTYWDDYMENMFTHLEEKGVDVSSFQLGSVPTDIPQDFLIPRTGGLSIDVPEGARYLFICVMDCWYSENTGQVTVTLSKDSDSDGIQKGLWFYVALGLGMAAFAAMVVWLVRKKRRRSA